MTSRNEAIEIAAKALHPDYDSADFGDEWKNLYRTRANAVYDALLAAGVIPAEGTKVVERGRFERVLAASDDFSVWSEESAGAVIEAADKLIPGDLDAIPAAPTGEETP